MIVKEWIDNGVRMKILKHPHLDHYCGYCTFDSRPLAEPGYRGTATYVPVHGGITYAEPNPDGSFTYGFDCGHAGDSEKPELRDLEWLGQECSRMAKAIIIAAEFEADYLASSTNEQRAKILDAYHKALEAYNIIFKLSDNFGAMISILGGSL